MQPRGHDNPPRGSRIGPHEPPIGERDGEGMGMKDFFARARSRRTVLVRTRKGPQLPELMLYVEWRAGEMKRLYLDAQGEEHLLSDVVVQSHYRFATGTQAKELLGKHWADQAAKKEASTPPA